MAIYCVLAVLLLGASNLLCSIKASWLATKIMAGGDDGNDHLPMEECTEEARAAIFLKRPFDFMMQDVWNHHGYCRSVANWLRQCQSQRSAPRTQTFHSEIELPENEQEAMDYRKQQISILSFLASQDESMILHLWTADKRPTPTWLTSLLGDPRYGHRLRFEYFEPETFISELPWSSDRKEVLLAAFQNNKHRGSLSDIIRYLILYFHGGIWFDTDTVFLSDVSALLDEDFVTVTQKNFLNGAVLGTSGNRSQFMADALEECANRYSEAPNSKVYYQYGPKLLGDLHADTSKPLSFHVLPGCLVDSRWVGDFEGPPSWKGFFLRKASKAHMRFLTDRTNGPFSYHWHGRRTWSKDVVDGSPGARLHAMLVKELKLDSVMVVEK